MVRKQREEARLKKEAEQREREAKQQEEHRRRIEAEKNKVFLHTTGGSIIWHSLDGDAGNGGRWW